ncbi:hypothetical protein Ancab_016745 [Ancistrocladus abbreviatus]
MQRNATTSIPSPANKQNTESNLALVSSRWSSREDKEEPILETRDRHNSPDPSRQDGKKARAEERSKRDTDDGALIVQQQSDDGDLFGGKRPMDVWEIPISLMKGEKGKKKKNNKTSEQYPVVSLEYQNLSWT